MSGSDWLGLQGRNVVITGAGGGIGRALAVSFAMAGASVALIERNEESAEQTARTVADEVGTRALIIACDVTQPDSVDVAAKRVLAQFGGCDVLVNNAALLRPGSLDTLTLAEWNAGLSVNLNGYFLCAQAFGRQMRAKSAGAIVNVASISASHPQGQSSSYSASKAAVVMLSQQLATEWGPMGVRSNVVSPGMIETPMTRDFYETPGVRERRSAVVPMRRIGRPQDVADAAVFLASARASYVNGQEIVVDGGYTRMLMNLIPRPGFESQ